MHVKGITHASNTTWAPFNWSTIWVRSRDNIGPLPCYFLLLRFSTGTVNLNYTTLFMMSSHVTALLRVQFWGRTSWPIYEKDLGGSDRNSISVRVSAFFDKNFNELLTKLLGVKPLSLGSQGRSIEMNWRFFAESDWVWKVLFHNVWRLKLVRSGPQYVSTCRSSKKPLTPSKKLNRL